jgi:predicted double-glycine peptidase
MLYGRETFVILKYIDGQNLLLATECLGNFKANFDAFLLDHTVY